MLPSFIPHARHILHNRKLWAQQAFRFKNELIRELC